MNPLELLHDKVQAYIYGQKWTEFRPIQSEAIQFICKSNENLIICAPTASGKTEAAFLPIVSEIADDFGDSYRAIYISPLKALINDQFKRIDHLCRDIGVPVTKWHGDVGQNLKTKSLENPKGILLITPESLEAMFLNKRQLLRNAFSKLKFVVIDEIHSFVGNERGAQLYSLLNRLRFECKIDPKVIGLSATIGNPEQVGTWVSGAKRFVVVEDKDWNDRNGVAGIIHGFTSKVEEKEGEEYSVLDPTYFSSISSSFQTGTNLVFGNSKKKLEETLYMVKQVSEIDNLKTEFLIHHGSLSKYSRETAEETLKEKKEGKSITVFCTSTLEMGIDIGAIEKVGLIDPPWSVSGFAQRIGRSGRSEGSSKKFEFFINQEEVAAESGLSELLREDLVKSIAVVQLYLEGFKEPLSIQKPHLSTLVHQILSLSAQYQGIKKETLIDLILKGSFKSFLNEDEFLSLVDHLIKNGILFRDTADLICPGRIGERLVDHYQFYSVFVSTEQWAVVCNGQDIGQVPIVGVYKIGDHLLLGGQVWEIKEVVEDAKKLIVIPAKRALAPTFTASFGLTHKRIHQKMLEIYESNMKYKFLDDKALDLLEQGRAWYKRTVISNSPTVFPLFEGSVIQNTISNVLNLISIDHAVSETSLELTTGSATWIKDAGKFLETARSNVQLASMIPRGKKIIEKYDNFLPEHLLNITYAESYIDIHGAHEWLKKLKENK